MDTSVVFPHKMGPPLKRALRNLTSEYLQRIIQEDGTYNEMKFFLYVYNHILIKHGNFFIVGGHDSKEDALAALGE